MEDIKIQYFIFGNKPSGKYQDSIWDTRTILETGEYYFLSSVNLLYKPQIGDKVIFKEFDNKIYWGEAEIENKINEFEIEDGMVTGFKLKNIKKWLFKLKTDVVSELLSNGDTRARILLITEKDYQIIIKEMENNSMMDKEKQIQLVKLWDRFKNNYSMKIIDLKIKDYNILIQEWNVYKNKIENDDFTIDDYTNIKSNGGNLGGWYLCNFLERSTRDIFGSSKPGNAFNFGVKLNSDNETYTIGKNKPNASKADAISHFEEQIKPVINKIIKSDMISEIIDAAENNNIGAKQILRKLAVLNKDLDFIYIYSDDSIDKLYSEIYEEEELSNLAKNNKILNFYKELFSLSSPQFADIFLLSRFLWEYSNTKSIVDRNNPNVIFYGPPGTGKTYNVIKNLEFICGGDKSTYEIIQFHPSFTYEDFIEGIKPKGVTTDGSLKFEMVNGVFKEFCIKAKNNPDKDYYFVIDEINRANLSSVFGETLTRLEKEYRHKVKSETNNDINLIKTQYSTLIKDLEPSLKTKLSYSLIGDEVYFGIPDNVFFIGMMNDVDKSIDTFDLALRRRFKWIRMDCDYNVVLNECSYKDSTGFNNIEEYVNACKNLNEYISITLNLGKSYEFGHSFFLKINSIAKRKTISSENLNELFELFLKPTLKEYLRAFYSENELDSKLSEASLIFSIPK